MMLPIKSVFVNTPTRVQRGLAMVPWEFSLFKQLTSDSVLSSNTIQVEDLIAAYNQIMKHHGFNSLSSKVITSYLHQIILPSGKRLLLDSESTIAYRRYHDSLRWFAQLRAHYQTPTPRIAFVKQRFDLYKYAPVLMTLCLDTVFIMLMILWQNNLGVLLTVSKVAAIIIMTNLIYLMIPVVGVSRIVPDKFIANRFPSEYSFFYHVVFGIKVGIASVVHIIGHLAQIRYAIKKCINGCSTDSIRIVSKSNTQIIISYRYFLRQYSYVSGILLTILFIILFCFVILGRIQYIRFTVNQLFHRYVSIMSIIMIIAHGATRLLGSQFSLLLTVPILLIYLLSRWREIFPCHVRINRSVISPTIIRLYLQDDKLLNEHLRSFGVVTVYTKYKRISRMEWHPFTLSRGHNSTDAVLTIKRIGQWTNRLANILSNTHQTRDHIHFGHFTRSKFRFHRLYAARYFFCAGMGITPFIASMVDGLRDPIDSLIKTTLLWSVSNITVISEFSDQIADMQKHYPNLKVKIFYSNSSKEKSQSVSYDMRIKFLYLQSVIYGSLGIDIITGFTSPTVCYLERIDFNHELAYAVMANQYLKKDKTVGVFICGSRAYSENVKRSVELYNRNKLGVRFIHWSESV